MGVKWVQRWWKVWDTCPWSSKPRQMAYWRSPTKPRVPSMGSSTQCLPCTQYKTIINWIVNADCAAAAMNIGTHWYTKVQRHNTPSMRSSILCFPCRSAGKEAWQVSMADSCVMLQCRKMDKQPFKWTASVLLQLVVQLQEDCKRTATAVQVQVFDATCLRPSLRGSLIDQIQNSLLAQLRCAIFLTQDAVHLICYAICHGLTVLRPVTFDGCCCQGNDNQELCGAAAGGCFVKPSNGR